MLTRSQVFHREVDAKVAARMREVWNDLEPGDRIVVMLDGRRKAVTFVDHLAPDALIREDGGREVLINRYQFEGKRPGGDGDV